MTVEARRLPSEGHGSERLIALCGDPSTGLNARMCGSLHGWILRVREDGGVVRRPDATTSKWTAQPECLIREAQ